MSSTIEKLLAAIGRGPAWASQVDDLQELQSLLDGQERRYADLVKNTEKTIIFADPDKPAKTPIALNYFHGFSASRQEAAPVPDRIAADLGMNLFYTRLAGHGRSGAALGRVKMRDWMDDATEAWEIGHKLGEKQVLMACSTGACLALQLAARYPDHVAALILISPNYGLRDAGANLLAMPGGALLARVLVGKEKRRPPGSREREKYWTGVYPSKALIPMIRLLRFTAKLDLTNIKVPLLTIHSPDDQVLDVARVRLLHRTLGSEPKRRMQLHSDHDPTDHILIGDILAPSNTDKLVKEISKFLCSLPS